jgi:hypothetical protein
MDVSGTSAEHFRRRWGTAVWHFSRHCSEWPATMACEERVGLPRAGSVCPECAMLAADTDPSDHIEGAVERHQVSQGVSQEDGSTRRS